MEVVMVVVGCLFNLMFGTILMCSKVKVASNPVLALLYYYDFKVNKGNFVELSCFTAVNWPLTH